MSYFTFPSFCPCGGRAFVVVYAGHVKQHRLMMDTRQVTNGKGQVGNRTSYSTNLLSLINS